MPATALGSAPATALGTVPATATANEIANDIANEIEASRYDISKKHFGCCCPDQHGFTRPRENSFPGL